MKQSKVILPLMFLVISQTAMAQESGMTELTNHYYGIKNALVADDGKTASEQAVLFLKSVDAITGLNESQEEAWAEHKSKLISTGEAMSNSTDVNTQRKQLNEMSVALFAVLKAFGTNGSAVYYQYCPMKKAYWLSSEEKIRNPYYGKKMLTCGSVEETLK